MCWALEYITHGEIKRRSFHHGGWCVCCMRAHLTPTSRKMAGTPDDTLYARQDRLYAIQDALWAIYDGLRRDQDMYTTNMSVAPPTVSVIQALDEVQTCLRETSIALGIIRQIMARLTDMTTVEEWTRYMRDARTGLATVRQHGRKTFYLRARRADEPRGRAAAPAAAPAPRPRSRSPPRRPRSPSPRRSPSPAPRERSRSPPRRVPEAIIYPEAWTDEPPAPEGAADTDTCILCKERMPATVMTPCGHSYSCVNCVRTSRPQTCARCRAPIQGVYRVWGL